MKTPHQTNKRYTWKGGFWSADGYALVLMIALLSALALTAAVILTYSVKIMKINENKIDAARIYVVRDALRNYYSGHGDLPVPDGTKVPAGALGLDQKYRIDSHGQFYYYHKLNIITDTDPPFTTDRTDITKLNVNGKDVAGVVIGFGSNQIQETIGTTGTTVFTSSGDDLVVPVNVADIAIKNCNKEQHDLARKICAYGKAGMVDLSTAVFNDTFINSFIDSFALSKDLKKDPWFNNYLYQYQSGDLIIESWGPDNPDIIGDFDSGNNLIVSIDASACVPPGNPGNPHLISTPQQLQDIGTGIYDLWDSYLVINDIHIPSEFGNFNPIGGGWIDDSTHPQFESFTGNFNGQGYEISGLKIDDPNGTDLGLFASAHSTAIISNVRLTGVNIIGKWDLGAIAGTNSGTIYQCSSTGSIEATNPNGVAGGIVGTNRASGTPGVDLEPGIIHDCYSTVSVSADKAAGGLVGNHRDTESVIENCYAAGSVFFTGATGARGGLAGQFSDGTPTIISSYYDSTLFGNSNDNKGDPLTTSQMTNAADYQTNFSGWDFTDVWKPPTGTEYPKL